MRNMTLTASETLITEVCCNCGVLFAMPKYLQVKLRENREYFYCPNGHQQHYTGKSEAEEQRERAERLATQVKQMGNRLETEKRSHSATKGKVTKLKNRIANGVCPCCNRTFANLGKHMANQHPEFEGED